MSVDLVRNYLPVMATTKLIKDNIEKGHSNIPAYLQMSNSVLGGVISGAAYSQVLYGLDLARAARKDAPNQPIGQYVRSYMQKTGAQGIRQGLSEYRITHGSRGALVGAAVFAADQLYKKVISKD